MKRFNPYKIFNGSFIPEAVSRVPVKELSHGCKIVYGRLARYAGKDGICKPKRATIAREVGVSVAQVDRLIKELSDYGLIEKDQRGLQKSNVYHFLWHDIYEDMEPSEVIVPEPSKVTTPLLRESVEESIYKYILPSFLGKNYQRRIFNFYSLVWKGIYGVEPTPDYARLGRTLKSLHGKFSEYQIAMLILTHFNWKGASGRDEFAYKRLSEACFPLDWIPKAVDAYRAFIINTDGIAFESEDACKRVVDRYLKIT